MKRAVAWFAGNGVAANLLMMLVVVGGLTAAPAIKREIFPEFSSEMISITVAYPGAAPEEVEEAVVIRVEENVQDLDGIKEVRSTAAENVATVMVEALPGADLQKLLGDVKNRVDAISSFPEETEEPIIQEVLIRRQVIDVAVSGAADPHTLRRLGEDVREDLTSIDGITQVELLAVRPYEISVEVSEEALTSHGLTFDDVATAVRRSAIDLPGGNLETRSGELLLRTDGQVYRGVEFEELPLLTLPDGRRLSVGDVATVVDGFADTDQASRFDGRPTVLIQVYRVGDQNALEIAEKVEAYLAEARARMPEGIELTTWNDQSRVLRSRLDLLARNGRMGFVLVFLVLALFLRLALAGWVSLGIPVSFLGAVALMPWFDLSINLISLFAFIVVLGIVVDDAIVVGENIYRHYQRGQEGLEAAVAGTHRVVVPVTFAVLTSVAAFAPLLFVPGNMGKIMRVIPIIVISTLLFSLVESLLILPYHLSHLRHGAERRPGRLRAAWRRVREAFASRLDQFVDRAYRPALRGAVSVRYLVLAIAISVLLVTGALVGGGWIRFLFFPTVEADFAAAILELPQGTPAEVTAAAVQRLEESAEAVRRQILRELGQDVVSHSLASVGEQPFRSQQSQGPIRIAEDYSGGHLGEVAIELVPSEDRPITSDEVADRWRQETGAIADAVSLTFTSSIFSPGEPINVQLSGPDIGELQSLAASVKEELRRYSGVRDIADSYRAGKEEVAISITREAEAAGLTLRDLARQVRQAFYGEEAQRIQRGRDEVKVMVRLPEASRRSIEDLEALRIRTPSGLSIPFTTAAEVGFRRGPAAVERVDRRRVIRVTADVDAERGNAGAILADLEARVLPELLVHHPRVRYSFEGQQEEQRETVQGLVRGFLVALVAIYALLAVPFRSYLQPLIVMVAVPFGLIGAVLGHVLMGLELTILSMFGLVALTGVVVNDSLIMVDFINTAYRGGGSLETAIREAGVARFRPILLTSLTTFAGLTPLLLERSVQAQFLIPMAVSLAFGVLFATAITLILVPVGYVVLEDLKRALGGLVGSRPRAGADEAARA